MKREFKILNQSNKRLDKFLHENNPDFSRGHIQRQIKSGAVLVNGEIKKPSYILKQSDSVEADILPPEKISLEPDASINFDLIYEDDDVLVIDKPAGLTVHPSDSQKGGTLANGLIFRYPLLKDVGDSPSPRSGQLRPGIVHRLDKDTSGLMVVAKTQAAFEFLKAQFQEGKVEKKYLALVAGNPEQNEGQIESFIARSKSDPTKQKISQKEGKKAITFYKVLEQYPGFALLEMSPKTGRMHQIRVHLAWLGYPVAGDLKYGPKNKILPEGLKRHFLHAAELQIALPSGQTRHFSSPLPPELKEVVSLLKKS